ncbi:hypothetical protein I4F81_009518 [Pyropia yezoensis]|uniref:Uncharacterized protein n=1 Tax=Pyropia yezoensis TaxID=2788 RepID=A0ACC3C9Z5_PYRYE|nr:hypothetical protein I4F81_009518 [Neopyropia yezoensis]
MFPNERVISSCRPTPTEPPLWATHWQTVALQRPVAPDAALSCANRLHAISRSVLPRRNRHGASVFLIVWPTDPCLGVRVHSIIRGDTFSALARCTQQQLRSAGCTPKKQRRTAAALMRTARTPEKTGPVTTVGPVAHPRVDTTPPPISLAPAGPSPTPPRARPPSRQRHIPHPSSASSTFTSYTPATPLARSPHPSLLLLHPCCRPKRRKMKGCHRCVCCNACGKPSKRRQRRLLEVPKEIHLLQPHKRHPGGAPNDKHRPASTGRKGNELPKW